MKFILRNRKLKIFTTELFGHGNWFANNGASVMEELTRLPELEQIIVKRENMENCLILKTILGS